MGSAMGEDPEILKEVCGWVMSAAKAPVWAKMTPNVTHVEDPSRAALAAGSSGISAINTIRSVIGVNLETLRPEPSVEGFTTLGGYSCKAVMPIALRICMEIAQLIRDEFPGRSLSGMGGVESGNDAAQFILLGCDTVQVCTHVMKVGYRCVREMLDELTAFMDMHKFESLADFRGHSLQYFTTHHDLVRRQAEARQAARKVSVGAQANGQPIAADHEWRGDDFVKQSDALARG
jgi:dihydroorotate dehydrogenase